LTELRKLSCSRRSAGPWDIVGGFLSRRKFWERLDRHVRV